LRDGIPVWVIAAAGAVLLMLVFVALRFAINSRSEPSFDALQALDVKAATATPTPPPPPAAAPRLAGFLKPDIDAGLVEVRDLADRSVIIIRGDGFFEPGSADIADRVRPLLGRIADALNQVPGPVLVTGHTDSQPLARSARFPSNWHLSEERARSVRDLLVSRQVAADRIRAEGRADADPLVANDTPGNRALNRRVEVTLIAGRAGTRAAEPASAAK